jgi:hypothetical protein
MANGLLVPGGLPCAFHSARRASMTSMRAARTAGTEDATQLAKNRDNTQKPLLGVLHAAISLQTERRSIKKIFGTPIGR